MKHTDMYYNLLQLKRIKGATDAVKKKVSKAWTWELITDEEYEELMAD